MLRTSTASDYMSYVQVAPRNTQIQCHVDSGADTIPEFFFVTFLRMAISYRVRGVRNFADITSRWRRSRLPRHGIYYFLRDKHYLRNTFIRAPRDKSSIGCQDLTKRIGREWKVESQFKRSRHLVPHDCLDSNPGRGGGRS